MNTNLIEIIKDSVGTSISLKIFKTKEESTFAHIFKSKLVKFSMKDLADLKNFYIERLQPTAAEAYPPRNRPRGLNDIKSVIYFQKKLQKKEELMPIWIVCKKKQYTLLDGAHRIVANYIENKKNILANIIYL